MTTENSNCSVSGVSRRNFLRTLGAASAAAAALPAAAAFSQQAAPQAAVGQARRRDFGSDMGETRVMNPNTVIISSKTSDGG
jgi:histidinol-phosphate aminotransferase